MYSPHKLFLHNMRAEMRLVSPYGRNSIPQRRGVASLTTTSTACNRQLLIYSSAPFSYSTSLPPMWYASHLMTRHSFPSENWYEIPTTNWSNLRTGFPLRD
ncbi:uncharacterized protein TRIVIDRAFT_216285 [Trichoderma virens Gv29-8]|uniref:Uncharacterized protein n=1 Tax=Hypocrea virens (strain Gv29-8 / FGSC 10586) TaxID=413071 RepID=G9MX50_HYPVG|nr:uncharacterized protein TRIVIDRAFT_216285 [Trichoderma virens Gv29-8]EHK20983.1 hypothetical protein TRIVIDRAFT_216285 [Trichoderma virens Gv29-8]